MEIVNVPISELKPNTKNPRKISKLELNKLIRSIKEFGFVDPVIVNKNKERYNIIIGGHQRVLAARKMGHKEVPVYYVDLIEEKESLLNIALNEISGEWDETKLASLLKDLQDKEVDLTLTGFDEPFIDEILAADDEEQRNELIDIVPEEPEEPKSKPGEIYILGKHRLMCGDSTKEKDIKALMAGKIADMCFTDPPYGVSYRGTNNPDGRDWGVMDNDDLRGDELYNLLHGIYNNVAKYTKNNAAMYTCYASINHIIFEKAINEAGFIVKQQLIWEKGHVLGHSDYHWSHEPILYCRKKDLNTEWYGDRTHKTFIMGSTIEQMEEMTKERLIEIISLIQHNSNVIHQKKDSVASYLHSTQKPVDLSKNLIKNNTRSREAVLEPCGGSGSTLMACEVAGRVCYCMEISSKYTDVTLTRWEGYTKKEAIRESDKKPWKEIKSS